MKIIIRRSKERNFLYTHIPKNAGTSIFRGVIEKEVADIETLFVDKLPLVEDYFAFTIVRNPYIRIVSLWNYFLKVGKLIRIPKCTFREFLEKDYVNYNQSIKNHSVPQYNRIFLEGFIASVENLKEDWLYIAEKIKVSSKLPMKNSHCYKHYTEYYDNWCKEKVSEMYAKDIEMLDYKFGD